MHKSPFGLWVLSRHQDVVAALRSPHMGSNEHEADWFKYIYIQHRRIALARPGKTEDIAGPAFFFCCDDSRYVTGHIMPVDGGMMSTL